MLSYCLFSAILMLSGCSAGYVATKPADVVYVRPVSPGPGYVWIGGEWEWRSGNYHWQGRQLAKNPGGPFLEIRLLGKWPEGLPMEKGHWE